MKTEGFLCISAGKRQEPYTSPSSASFFIRANTSGRPGEIETEQYGKSGLFRWILWPLRKMDDGKVVVNVCVIGKGRNSLTEKQHGEEGASE